MNNVHLRVMRMVLDVKKDMEDVLWVDGECILSDHKFVTHTTQWDHRLRDGSVTWHMRVEVDIDEYFKVGDRKERTQVFTRFGPACRLEPSMKQVPEDDIDSDEDPKPISE